MKNACFCKPQHRSHLFSLSLVSLCLGVILSLSGCSTLSTSKILPPGLPEVDSQREVDTVVIFGLNDFHGALFSREEPSPDHPSESYQLGGAALLASHIRNLRKEFGSRFLVLDAGDQWQGTLESNLDEGEAVVRFFNSIQVDASAIGNHEFDFGPVGPVSSVDENSSHLDSLGNLKQRLKEAKYPYLAANLYDKKSKTPLPLPNVLPHVILEAGKIKVGVIGLSTVDTLTATTVTNYMQKNIYIENLRKVTVEQSKILRNQGADLVIVLAHAGLDCHSKSHNFQGYQSRIWKSTDSQPSCDNDSEISTLLNTLPQGIVDAVVSGHSHKMVHHWVKGVPVIQSKSSGHYFNLLYLPVDLQTRKVIPEWVRIEGPIPVCSRVFSQQGNCNSDQVPPSLGRGELVTPKLHGKTIHPDSDTEQFLEGITKSTENLRKKVVGYAQQPLTHTKTQESELGNLVADALRKAVGADFGLVNPGGIRTSIDPGPITYEEIFRALPFDNSVSLVRLTGKELKNILRVANCGSRGFFGVSGLQLKLLDLGERAPSRDLNRDGEISHWEVNRLLDVRLPNGKRIENNRYYTLAAPDFLVNGGDNLSWPMSQIAKKRIQLNAGGLMRDAVISYLDQMGPANPPESPLVNPANPRLILKKANRR